MRDRADEAGVEGRDSGPTLVERLEVRTLDLAQRTPPALLTLATTQGIV